MRITILPRGDAGPGQCPYCRDPIDGDDVAACTGCGVRLHRDCHAQLLRCVTVGCAVPVRRFAGAQRALVAERFEVYQRLGLERWGLSVHAWDQREGRAVALLYLSMRSGDVSDVTLAALAQAGGLRAPGLVPIVGWGRDARGDRPFLVRELVPGETVEHFMARRGPLMLDEVVWAGTRLLDVLAPLHARGLAHGGLSSGALLIARPEGEQVSLRVRDFGLAAHLTGAPRTTSVSMAATLSLILPEALLGERAVSPVAADRWATGAILYHALTGRWPVEARSVMDLVRRGHPITPLRAHLPRVSPQLERAIDGALARGPAARHADTPAFRRALAAVPV